MTSFQQWSSKSRGIMGSCGGRTVAEPTMAPLAEFRKLDGLFFRGRDWDHRPRISPSCGKAGAEPAFPTARERRVDRTDTGQNLNCCRAGPDPGSPYNPAPSRNRGHGADWMSNSRIPRMAPVPRPRAESGDATHAWNPPARKKQCQARSQAKERRRFYST